MQGENTPIECSVVELEMFDLGNKNLVELPMVYSRPSLPIRPDAIGKQEDVDRWPYLKGITIPHIEAEVGLLIGSDVPQALQPREVRQSENGGPLGSVLNGPLGREETKVPTAYYVQGDNTLSQQFEEFCNMEFNDLSHGSKASMSQNDRRALTIMGQTVKMENGHYEMALPWKNYPPHLPNNKSLAEQRLRPLKRRLQRDPVVLEKYKTTQERCAVKISDHCKPTCISHITQCSTR